MKIDLTKSYDEDRPTVFREILKLSRTREYYRAKELEALDRKEYPYSPPPLPPYTPPPKVNVKPMAFIREIYESLLP